MFRCENIFELVNSYWVMIYYSHHAQVDSHVESFVTEYFLTCIIYNNSQNKKDSNSVFDTKLSDAFSWMSKSLNTAISFFTLNWYY